MARSSTTFGLGNKAAKAKLPASAEVRGLARAHTAEAIETLVRVMRCRIPQARVAATRELLDRGHGKAPNVATDLSQISDAELIAEFRRRADARTADVGSARKDGGGSGVDAAAH